MAVYVDQPIFPFRQMMMCHLWADSLHELHAMADRLGLKRAWFQCRPRASWEHYDIAKAMRTRAVSLGAVETDRYGALYFVAQQRGQNNTIARINRLRARKTALQFGLIQVLAPVAV